MKLDIPSLSEAVATPAVAPSVLVVEGDETRRACLSTALKGWGYEVVSEPLRPSQVITPTA